MAQTQTQTVLTLNGRTITLVGTAHISEKSVSEVSETIKTIRPDCVAIELDQNRCNSITNSLPNSPEPQSKTFVAVADFGVPIVTIFIECIIFLLFIGAKVQ